MGLNDINVNFNAGAFTLPAADAPVVNINERAVVVEAAAPEVNFADGAIRVEPSDVNVTVPATLEIDARAAETLLQQQPMVVHVEPTPVTVENTVNVPKTPVNVHLPSDEPTDATVEFKRNPDGSIKSARITEDV